MPAPTRSASPHLATPSRSKQSNSTSYSPTITAGSSHQKLNVVTRVAIEGKVKKGQDGASVKVFLKIAIPLDSVTPGSTIPLFPEENLKVLTYQVHPLDSNSIPYNFSSTISPLLHSAARALNLPARSSQTFDTALKQARSNGHASSIRFSKPESSDSIAPVDSYYAGQILVNNYQVAFALPKEFLSRPESEDDTYSTTPLSNHSRHKREDATHERTPKNRRRHSITERNQVQFMAAIDMWVPFLSKPPRSPFLLSIPTPRCLHNHIKLRIAPPDNASTSFASLASMDEDCTAWDLAYEPSVTQVPTSRSRSGSYGNLADDESSDTDTAGSSEICVIQGTFPSAERIRLRWAKPTKSVNIPGEDDQRRRVGVENVKGETTCSILGKALVPGSSEEGVLMDMEYKGSCKGIWFPGVATLLGLDISLVGKGCEVYWAPGRKSQWDVEGGTGYTGFANASSPLRPPLTSRTLSVDSNGQSLNVTPTEMYETARTQSNASISKASLLRAPLPTPNVGDVSMEGSNISLPSNVSSASFPNSSEINVPPKPISTITLHLNMNDLQPTSKNGLSFKISGTILVVPRRLLPSAINLASSITTDSDKGNDQEPIFLPRFTVLAADVERTLTNVKNEVENATVEVFRPHGDIHRDPQVRKTVLQKDGATRCGEDGGRISLKFFDPQLANGSIRVSGSRSRTPSNTMASRPPRNPLSTRAKREGPPIITSVNATITALTPGDGLFPDGYAVRLSLNTPAIVDSEWLEFGMSRQGNRQILLPAFSNLTSAVPDPSNLQHDPKVVLICASIDGVPVHAELTNATKRPSSTVASFEDVGGKDWICWGKVYAGAAVGGRMVIDYLVREDRPLEDKGKKKAQGLTELDILLPTFSLSIARFEAKIDAMPGLDMSNLHSEFDYINETPDGHRLLLCSVKEYTQPKLSLVLRKSAGNFSFSPSKWLFILILTLLLAACASLYQLYSENSRLKGLRGQYSAFDETWEEIQTVTSTITVYPSFGSDRQLWEPESSTSPSITPTSSISQPAFTNRKPHSTITTAASTTATYDQAQPPNDTGDDSINLFSHSPLEIFGLVPIAHFFSFTWTEEHSATFKEALEKMSVGMHIVWNWCRIMYHYPLDPP
ncbi:hypothetical protein CPB83DRAFT_794094 [Crepidotus variabilis]|uniref:Uncharacterized protein n=1 Tax=Crepidotus variabilis TaxID=179855 RepID=A0A9P6EDJ5_9AGAR|nr:hypothetical protein CPB83DRAFT_794094 [Crepidotus variabilis]